MEGSVDHVSLLLLVLLIVVLARAFNHWKSPVSVRLYTEVLRAENRIPFPSPGLHLVVRYLDLPGGRTAKIRKPMYIFRFKKIYMGYCPISRME